MSGFYLALEGAEGAGKSTVSRAVTAELRRRGHHTIGVREPGGTNLGEAIRELLLHTEDMTAWAEAALFAAQRAQLAAEVVAPALARGTWVVSDRTYYSSLAYQGAARGLGIEPIRTLNQLVLKGVEPHLVVVLDVDPDVGLDRQVDADRIGAQGVEFQQAVAAAYRALAEQEPDRVVLIEADRPPEELARVIADLAEERSR